METANASTEDMHDFSSDDKREKAFNSVAVRAQFSLSKILKNE